MSYHTSTQQTIHVLVNVHLSTAVLSPSTPLQEVVPPIEINLTAIRGPQKLLSRLGSLPVCTHFRSITRALVFSSRGGDGTKPCEMRMYVCVLRKIDAGVGYLQPSPTPTRRSQFLGEPSVLYGPRKTI